MGSQKKRNTFRQVLIYQLNVLKIEGGLWAHLEWPTNPHRKYKMNKWNRHDTVGTVQGIRIIWYVMSYLRTDKSTCRFLERDASLWWNFHNPYVLVYFQVSLVLYLWNLVFPWRNWVKRKSFNTLSKMKFSQFIFVINFHVQLGYNIDFLYPGSGQWRNAPALPKYMGIRLTSLGFQCTSYVRQNYKMTLQDPFFWWTYTFSPSY